MNTKVERAYEKHNVPSPLSSVQNFEENITIPIAFVNLEEQQNGAKTQRNEPGPGSLPCKVQ
jgi:hypothetical protein